MNPITIYIINRILDMFNLVWTPGKGLEYYQVINFGRISFLVTRDFNKVLDFLGLPELRTNDVRMLYEIIKYSKYFNKQQFFRRPLKSPKYREFLFYIRTEKPLDQYKPTATTSISLEQQFGVSIESRILLLYKKGFNRSSLRNKYNGKLVMRWVGIESGLKVAETMNRFKEYIECTSNKQFMEYLAGRTPKQVRTDFINHYNDCTVSKQSQKLPY